MPTHKLTRDLNHGHGTIGKGCDYRTVEAMLRSRVKHCSTLAGLVRDWLAASPLSERISARRCRELLDICNRFDSSEDSAS